MGTPVYKRVLLKLSGEALSGGKGQGIDNDVLKEIGATINELSEMGVEVAIVVGGGNFWRGREHEGMDRVTADHIGMIATAMNSLAISDALEQAGAVTRVLSAIEMRQFAEPYIRKRAIRHLEKGRVVIFACGTGNPYFSTDTAAALRCKEIEADILLKATMVDGVYDKDPKKCSDAKKYSHVDYDEILLKNLGIMDATAAALCRDNKIKIGVFNMKNLRNIIDIICGKEIGTIIS
ncbi:MAG: UMP kinase [Saccharofermentanales bacterium]